VFNALRCLVLALGEAVKRREFITLIGRSAAAWPLAARAQEQARSYRVAYLALAGDQDAVLVKQRLDELGYSGDKNLIFDFRSAGGQLERLAQLAVGRHSATTCGSCRRRT
jgi:putative tryptophan/tyrosine transport system substrate-binding protein